MYYGEGEEPHTHYFQMSDPKENEHYKNFNL